MSKPAKLLSGLSLSGLVAVGATNAWGHSQLLCDAYLGAFRIPVQDGVLAENEYTSCSEQLTQTVGGKTYLFDICVTNDRNDNYYAFRIDDDTNDVTDRVSIFFDDEHDGTVVVGPQEYCTEGPVEDMIGSLTTGSSETFFADGYYCMFGGRLNYGFGESTNGNVVRAFTAEAEQIYELSHPFASGDSHDYNLKVRERVGWCLVYDDGSNPITRANPVYFGDIQFPPGCIAPLPPQEPGSGAASGDTSLFGDVTIKSIGSQFGGDFVALTCEVQKAKITHGEGGGALSLSARLEKADFFLGSVTGSLTSRGEFSLSAKRPARRLLQASIEEARAFILEVNEHGGEIDANNGRGTAASWIEQAEATIARMEKLQAE